jgi:hypothetical protein
MIVLGCAQRAFHVEIFLAVQAPMAMHKTASDGLYSWLARLLS